MSYTAIIHGCKKDNFQMKKQLIFFLKTFNVGKRSNEYPQSMFYSKNEKLMTTPVNPNFTI